MRQPIDPTPIPDPTPLPPNNAPRITALAVSTDRVEVGEEITLTATVLDDETAPDELKYEWQATAGSFTGTGRVVKWVAPTSANTPAVYTILLTVVDQYGSGSQMREHRATAETSRIHVDDSPKTVRAVAEEFLRDFATNSMSPDLCVRNFSDSAACRRGKQSELEDIIDVRRDYVMLSHKFSVSNVRINMSRTRATVSGGCEFRSRRKRDNSIVVPAGTCELTLVNENYRWWLCESSMHDRNSAGLHFPF
jgi:hypothetical protein